MQILLIEPHAILSKELVSLGARVQVTSRTPDEAETQGVPGECDVIVLNLDDPIRRLDLIHSLKHKATVPIVVMAPEVRDVIVPCLEAGAHGYIPCGLGAQEVVSALESILQGKPYFAPEIGTALVERMHELAQLSRARLSPLAQVPLPPASKLSARELEILGLVTTGMSNQAIAAHLTLEVGTVKNHVHNILKKLQVSSRSQAAHYYSILAASDDPAIDCPVPTMVSPAWDTSRLN